jgi:hypothetical protein
VPVEAEQEVLEDMRGMRAEGASYGQIAAQLNAEGAGRGVASGTRRPWRGR